MLEIHSKNNTHCKRTLDGDGCKNIMQVGQMDSERCLIPESNMKIAKGRSFSMSPNVASAFSLRMSLCNIGANTSKAKKRVSGSEWLIISSDIGRYKTSKSK